MNDQVPISEARANLTELVANVRLLGRTVILTQRGKPRAAIVPLELLDQLDAGDDDAGHRDTAADADFNMPQRGGHGRRETSSAG